MRVSRLTVAVGLVAAVMAACSGAPAGTQGADDGEGEGTASEPVVSLAPVDPAPGGDDGNTGGGTGQIHIDIGGPASLTVDLPFFSFGSRFEGDAAGVQLNFATDGGPGIATISSVSDGVFIIGYVGDEGAFSAQTCTLTDWALDASSGSGSFDCTGGFATTMEGAYLADITMKGTFEAVQ
jgi:hypothetical protein